MTKGGKRPGAGRKPSPYSRKVFTAHCSDEQAERINQLIITIRKENKMSKQSIYEDEIIDLDSRAWNNIRKIEDDFENAEIAKAEADAEGDIRD